ncbi:unnamed protein product [Withania somnifera]
MVRAKGKANASTKRSVSGRATVSAPETALTNDYSVMENLVKIGGLVETAVTEKRTITVVAEEENDEAEVDTLKEENDGSEEDGAEAETLEEENDGSEEDNDGAEAETLEEENDGSEEENDGAEAETLEGEVAMNEADDFKENEVVGGDETSRADKKAEDAIGDGEGNKQETAIEQEVGKQNIDDKQVGGAAGIDKDNHEDGFEKNEEKKEVEGKEGKWNPQEKFENNQAMKKVASNGKVGKDSGELDSKVEQSSKNVASKDKSRVDPKDMDLEEKTSPNHQKEVRFTVLEECLPLAEETFRQAIKKNYYTRGKFDCQLSSEQVKDLCKLFTTARKGSRSKGKQLGPDTNVVAKRERVKRRDRDERRRPDHALRSERIEERRHHEQVEDRRYREQVEDRLYREQVDARVYREHPRVHERSLITSPLVPLAPLAPLQPLPPPSPVRSYAYERTLARDPYRRDSVIQHNDSYRQRSRLVELPDAYRRDTVISNPDVYGRQALVEPQDYYRREGVPERREYHHTLNLETRPQDAGGISDPYVSYPRVQPPRVGLRSEYRPGGLSTEYSSTRSMLPEYPSSAAGYLYEHPRIPQYRY